MDNFPKYWQLLEAAIDAGTVRAVDEVKRELERRDDAVTAWCRGKSALFVPLETDIQQAAREVLRRHPKLVGVGNGRNGADPFVIALASARGGTVVTQEQGTGSETRPRIPAVCKAMGINCINLLQFVEGMGWVF